MTHEICRDITILAPFVYDAAKNALEEANENGYPIEFFETHRSPERQNFLFEQGRSKPGKIITKSKAWESWHQYKLAFDIAYKINGKWSWEGDFDKVAQFFIKRGFEWLSPFEKVHFQITGGLDKSFAYKVLQTDGIEKLWNLVLKKTGLVS